MIDERTKHLGLPVPHEWNNLQVDLPRIRKAFQMLDEYLAGLGGIKEVAAFPDSPEAGVMYSLPDDDNIAIDESNTIKSISVSKTAVSDDSLQDGQLVITPAQDVLTSSAVS
ncbi:MAG: hypothetical protein IJ228_01745 [Succinivibrio sp.]|nr:hypothetical protein [Succinivibrio sp.]